MMNEEVRRIMTLNPEVADPGQTIGEVSQMLIDKRLQQLPVVEEGKFLGMITTYDLWRSIRTGESDDTVIRDVMNSNVIKIAPKDKVGTAAELFMDKRFKTLPVVNLRNELKGVVTSFDVMKYTLRREYDTPILYKEVLDS